MFNVMMLYTRIILCYMAITFIYHFVQSAVKGAFALSTSVAYLGFQKGGKFSLATNAHTKGGQTKFSNFFQCQRKIFLAKGGMAQWPPKYASAQHTDYPIYYSDGTGRIQLPLKRLSDSSVFSLIPADKGGPNFCWPLVLTQRGPYHVFLFFPMVKKFFFAKGGGWPNAP